MLLAVGSTEPVPTVRVRRGFSISTLAMTDAEERFWDKVEKRSKFECWEWQAGSRGGRYGAFRYNDKNMYAHRLVIYFSEGYMPPSDKVVCHLCDNPKCVNPNHLMVADQAENHFDASVKDRLNGPSELDNPQGKLTDEDVCELRRKFIETDATREELAEEYDLASSYVDTLLRHDRRADIDGTPPPVKISDFPDKNQATKLTEGDVREMRRRYENNPNLSYPELAEDYPVGKSSVRKIIIGEHWPHVKQY